MKSLKVVKYIKNPHIIHMLENTPNGVRYSCIWCCDPTPEKSTWNKTKVTCKNCLQKIERQTNVP